MIASKCAVCGVYPFREEAHGKWILRCGGCGKSAANPDQDSAFEEWNSLNEANPKELASLGGDHLAQLFPCHECNGSGASPAVEGYSTACSRCGGHRFEMVNAIEYAVGALVFHGELEKL